MKQIFKRNSSRLYLFTFIITLLYGLIFIFSEFYGSPFEGIKDFVYLFLQWGVVCFSTFGLMLFLVSSKVVFTLFFPLITLLCTVLTYFRYTANVALTSRIIELTLQTDVLTSLDVISWQLVLWLFLSLAVSILLVYYRVKYIHLKRAYLHFIPGLFIILLTNVWITKLVMPISSRMPYSIYYNMASYMTERKIIAEGRNTYNQISATCLEDSLKVIFVLGESLRADHLQLNGYHRATTPLLMKDTAVISFPNIYSEAYYTYTSVPHILTRADSVHTERAYNEQSFITLLKNAGYKTYWLANQDPVDSYVYFMNECDTLIYANNGNSLYRFNKWTDGNLLPFYQQTITSGKRNQFILLHTIGSHWWYNVRYPDNYKKFTPVINSRVVSSCTQEEMINSYDNTVLYTDTILYSIIQGLKDKKAILFYLSDHGEALGENGYYLHADDYPELHNPACLVWYSSKYLKAYPNKIKRVKENASKPYRTDFLFHSLLDAACVQTEMYNSSFSIFQ